MADRPILFSAPMVRALLYGHKTQTRRLFKPRGFEFYTHSESGDRYNEYRPYRDGTWDESRISGSGPMQAFGWGEGLYAYLPFAPGDRLWVKETWGAHWATDDQKPSEIDADMWSVRFFADDHIRPAARDGSLATADQFKKKRVAIFMPRWASRLTLTVTEVRVERLQDCTDADATAEGVEMESADPPFYYVPGLDARITGVGVEEPGGRHATRSYAKLWNHINGPGAWEANPWVVAVTFTVEQRNIDHG